MGLNKFNWQPQGFLSFWSHVWHRAESFRERKKRFRRSRTLPNRLQWITFWNRRIWLGIEKIAGRYPVPDLFRDLVLKLRIETFSWKIILSNAGMQLNRRNAGHSVRRVARFLFLFLAHSGGKIPLSTNPGSVWRGEITRLIVRTAALAAVALLVNAPNYSPPAKTIHKSPAARTRLTLTDCMNST